MGFVKTNKQRVQHTTQVERDRATEHVMLLDAARCVKRYRANFLEAARNIIMNRDRYKRHVWLMVTQKRRSNKERMGSIPTAIRDNGDTVVGIVADRDMEELTDDEWVFICSDVFAFSRAAKLFRLMSSK